MRGKAAGHQQHGYGSRITPAYAGKSSLLLCDNRLIKDHPRLCGEKNTALNISLGPVGSPPPMRGKGSFCFWCRVKDRITPAYAGKSIHSYYCQYIAKDHPRLCGEKAESAAYS